MVDPNMKEEASCAGLVSVVINNGHELCCLDKQGGLGLSMPQVLLLLALVPESSFTATLCPPAAVPACRCFLHQAGTALLSVC